MKFIHTLLCLTCFLYTTAQNSIYTVTEVYPSSPNSKVIFDSVYVTSPQGKVTKYSIPYISNVAAHDASFSAIINLVTSKGYRMMPESTFVRSDYYTSDHDNSRTVVRILFSRNENLTDNGDPL